MINRRLVVQGPIIGPGLLAAARDIEDQVGQFPADVLDRCFISGDAVGIEIDQIMPALRERLA